MNAPMQTMSGPIVNGGLIDFQDNFHRGMAEYANYQQAQQMAGAMGGMPSFPMQQQAFQPMQQFQSLPGLTAGPVPGVPGASQLPCISGPPAFLHVHGQTYVPVEAQPPVSAPKPVPVEAAPEPRVLSEEEIERRVRDRVEAWAASQRKPTYTGASSSESRKHLKGRAVSDEDRAAERINSVNAGMRGRFCSPI
jgi:hypothetical protein